MDKLANSPLGRRFLYDCFAKNNGSFRLSTLSRSLGTETLSQNNIYRSKINRKLNLQFANRRHVWTTNSLLQVNPPTMTNIENKQTSNGSASAAEGTVLVTENCAKRLNEIMTKNLQDANKFLRVSVEGGGCSGFQYKFEIDDKLLPDDSKFSHPSYDKALVVVDSTSLEYLKGSTVDFEVELIRSAFKVVQNPKADHGCSCGASFTVKID